MRDADERIAALIDAPPTPGMLRDTGIRQIERAGLDRRMRIDLVQPLDRARVPVAFDRGVEMLGLLAAWCVAEKPVHVGMLDEAFEEAFAGGLATHQPRSGSFEPLRTIQNRRIRAVCHDVLPQSSARA